MWREVTCVGSYEGRFRDQECTRDRPTLGIVGDAEVSVDVLVVRANTSERGEDHAMPESNIPNGHRLKKYTVVDELTHCAPGVRCWRRGKRCWTTPPPGLTFCVIARRAL